MKRIRDNVTITLYIRKDAQGTMTIQECYKKMGADYEDVLKRLYSEGMIRKFARMFLDDDSYPKLERSLKEEMGEHPVRHTRSRGYARTFGFTNLIAHL